ncbi:MAG: GNAT family N-acetyltransferase [Salibacteraceae bacterium]
MSQSILQGERIHLRAVEPADVDALYQWENNPENWKVSNTLIPFSRHLLEQYVHSEHDLMLQKQLRLMIISNENGAPVGCLDLFDFDALHLRAGLGIIIAEVDNRRKGLATEALHLIIRYGKEVIQLQQLYCSILSGNASSIALFEKAGFIRTGTRISWRRQADSWEDEHFYQVIFR